MTIRVLQRGRRLAVVLGAAGVFLAGSASATPQAVDPYFHLQGDVQRLDMLAQQARAGARTAPDRGLRDRIDRFADRTREFRQRIEDRRLSADKVGDQVRDLIEDASKLQRDIATNRRADPRIYGDWGSVMDVLARINSEHRADFGLEPHPVGTSGGGVPGVARDALSRLAPPAVRLQSLVAELSDRAARAARRSAGSSYDDLRPSLERFREDAAYLNRRFSHLAPAFVRTAVGDLMQQAARLRREFDRWGVPFDVRDDWADVVSILDNMRDLTEERVVGTSGFVAPPADGPASGPLAEAARLGRELDDRLGHALELAFRAGNDEVTKPVRDFVDRVRDYENEFAGRVVSATDRRNAIDRLLEEAQETQRELARRGVSDALVAEWNAIVNTLARLRNAS